MYINVNYDSLKLTNDGLNYGEILLYSLIVSYFESGTECYPSNEYLSELFATSTRNIQMWLTRLKKGDYVMTEYEDGKRYLTPGERFFTGGMKNSSC